jgi:hypothetical protein
MLIGFLSARLDVYWSCGWESASRHGGRLRIYWTSGHRLPPSGGSSLGLNEGLSIPHRLKKKDVTKFYAWLITGMVSLDLFIHSAQDIDQQRVLTNTVMNLRIAWSVGNLLTSWVTSNFSAVRCTRTHAHKRTHTHTWLTNVVPKKESYKADSSIRRITIVRTAAEQGDMALYS